MSPDAKDRGRFDGEHLHRIRADLNNQDPKERAKAEARARRAVEKAARSPEEKKSLLAMIFGRK